ncbi:hypothetical protein PGB90_006553 [Kerria lacca]
MHLSFAVPPRVYPPHSGMPPNSQNIPSQLLEARRCWKMLFHLNTALNEGTRNSLTRPSQENGWMGENIPFK